jgi:hypothetical protein
MLSELETSPSLNHQESSKVDETKARHLLGRKFVELDSKSRRLLTIGSSIASLLFIYCERYL